MFVVIIYQEITGGPRSLGGVAARERSMNIWLEQLLPRPPLDLERSRYCELQTKVHEYFTITDNLLVENGY